MFVGVLAVLFVCFVVSGLCVWLLGCVFVCLCLCCLCFLCCLFCVFVFVFSNIVISSTTEGCSFACLLFFALCVVCVSVRVFVCAVFVSILLDLFVYVCLFVCVRFVFWGGCLFDIIVV